MKTIYLVRHAKSSWEFNVGDIDRPLSRRGINDANLLTKEVLKYQIQPDAIYSSPANRALSTCKIFIKNLDFDDNLLSIKEKLYDFGGRQVADFIYNLDDSLDTVMIFGHNHAFTEIANKFGDEFIDNVPTCGLVLLQFNVDSWKNIDKGHTKKTLFPRHLKT